MVVKMGSGVSVVKRCAPYLSQSSIKVVAKALILSNLDYCSVVWSNATQEKLTKLQMVQNRVARIALRCGYRTNVVTMHKCLGWLFVRNRLFYSLCVFFRNILVTKKPSILYNKLPFSLDIHDYATRHATRGNFTLPKAKTNIVKRRSCIEQCKNGMCYLNK